MAYFFRVHMMIIQEKGLELKNTMTSWVSLNNKSHIIFVFKTVSLVLWKHACLECWRSQGWSLARSNKNLNHYKSNHEIDVYLKFWQRKCIYTRISVYDFCESFSIKINKCMIAFNIQLYLKYKLLTQDEKQQ